jgi:hypothetical protein
LCTRTRRYLKYCMKRRWAWINARFIYNIGCWA